MAAAARGHLKMWRWRKNVAKGPIVCERRDEDWPKNRQKSIAISLLIGADDADDDDLVRFKGYLVSATRKTTSARK